MVNRVTVFVGIVQNLFMTEENLSLSISFLRVLVPSWGTREGGGGDNFVGNCSKPFHDKIERIQMCVNLIPGDP